MSAPATILVVDDDPDFRDFVRIVLESCDHRVLEAADAPSGLTAMHEHHPDLVLLDAMMSYELAGITTIRTARNDPELAGIPLILISAVLNEDEDRFLPSAERGMVERFLSKPISPDALLSEIDSVIRSRPDRSGNNG